MEQIIISVTFAIVALVASLLLFDAANKVGPSKRSKAYRIVAGAILALMAACEYLIFSGIPAEKNKEVVLTDSDSINEDLPANTELKTPLDIQQSLAEYGRIATLKKTKEWNNFAAFWRKLASLETYYEYTECEIQYHILSAERIKVIHDLQNIPSNIIGYREISLLDLISEMRIDNIRRRDDISFISRMAEPIDINFIGSEKSGIIYDLESKIDALDNLRQQGAIDNIEFNEALEIIKEDIKIAILLDEIMDNYPEYKGDIQDESNVPNMQTIEKHIAEIGKNYRQYSSQKEADITVMMNSSQTSASAQDMLLEYQKNEYNSFKKNLEQTNQNYPVFSELIDGLERYKNE